MYSLENVDSGLDEWIWEEDHFRLVHKSSLSNTSLGYIQMVSVVDEEGIHRYQQPWWIESRGEIDLILTEQRQFVFVEAERHAVVPPAQYVSSWGNQPPQISDMEPGLVQLELPRGFSGHTMQEAEEETQYRVRYVDTIGQVNANTSFFGTSPLIVVYLATRRDPDLYQESNERIREVRLIQPSEVADIDTLCGFTRAALWEFCRWSLSRQEDEWWVGIGRDLLYGLLGKHKIT